MLDYSLDPSRRRLWEGSIWHSRRDDRPVRLLPDGWCGERAWDNAHELTFSAARPWRLILELDESLAEIAQFLASSKKGTEITRRFAQPIGRSIARGESAVSEVSAVKVALRKDTSDLGYYIKTAFPEP